MATETSVSDNQNPEINSPNKQIFILSGQSNMAGRGGVNKNHKWDGVVPPECRPNHGILRLSAKLHWETAHEPTHKDIDTKKTCGVGPGMAFANAVKAHLAQFGPVGLVPSAVGGTAIKEWARGEHLYEDMIKRAKESVKRGGEIRALLWYQGESDTSSEDQVAVYQEKMEKLIQNVRQDLSLPSLPIIQVAIISGVDKNCVEKLREVQLNMKVENVVCVDAKGLELKFDNLHLTTEAQVICGLRDLSSETTPKLKDSNHPLPMATETSNSDTHNNPEISSANSEINKPNKQIFILSGQSNMSGRGGVNQNLIWDGVVPPECQPDRHILRLSAKLHWETAREPLHADIDTNKTCGVGPGMAFANAVRAHLAQLGPLGLVPCAVGGTAIKEWARGEHLYEDMIKRAKESVKGGGEIRALLWYQGESDTSSEEDVVAYQGNMERLIQNIRDDLCLPSLPIIQVAINSGLDKILVEKLMKVANVVCVDAKGLELKFDNLHLTTKAQVELGHKLAQAYLSNFGQR
ncbi:hypothetical protein F8388_007991 [Cannabis sativa]|uniref:Sialate O-acetylesterase domain-containing protein n=1 Tax=Cannabis sativa TaxID=3483 RepID=A0A7J6FTT5_CANSA|nr:hypothetical protein F8388_007991 [Cannabis sativa]